MQEDIATKLLDFIAEPHANDDSSLSDDQVEYLNNDVCTFSDLFMS